MRSGPGFTIAPVVKAGLMDPQMVAPGLSNEHERDKDTVIRSLQQLSSTGRGERECRADCGGEWRVGRGGWFPYRSQRMAADDQMDNG